MKKSVGYLSVLTFFAVAVSVLKVISFAATSTSGLDLTNIQTKEALLEEENTQLHQTVYNLMSLNTVAEEAEKQGFTENTKSIIVIGTGTPFALRQ